MAHSARGTPKTLPSHDGRVPRRTSQAAELLAELEDDEDDEDDGFEPDVVVGLVEPDELDGFDDAGLLLDEEPRLSLR